MDNNEKMPFQFEISLSVLNHLGRNLYRNFITVLGEAISNSWDAEADNVWITIDRKNGNFIVKDDGNGMTSDDFQGKFLKVGYSKRKTGEQLSPNKQRPYIGAKGIGKLALLSCAEIVTVVSKTSSTEYVGGVINNSELDDAIDQDMTPQQYPLGEFDTSEFSDQTANHDKGTIIYFDQTKENIKNTIPYLKTLIALYFRFSLIDDSFNIHVNGETVTLDNLKGLSDSTEFLWNINELEDPYIDQLSNLKADIQILTSDLSIKGFIASVVKPTNLKIRTTDERVGIDLFVNGRLREKDLMKHIPTARITESYLYGQIHFDELDKDGIDRFTSSREGVVESDEKYKALLSEMKSNLISAILDKWDKLRLERGVDGDDESPRKTPKQRRAISLFNLTSDEYTGDKGNSPESDEIRNWINQLRPEAEFNVPAYVDCFLSENLIRKYIHHKNVPLTVPAQTEITQWKTQEATRKADANISFSIRKHNDDLSYLGMDFLAKVVDGNNPTPNTASLVRDAKEYKPMRNAVGHTGVLSDNAKTKLTLVYENIKGRLRTLLYGAGDN